jgi:hypothetical protein
MIRDHECVCCELLIIEKNTKKIVGCLHRKARNWMMQAKGARTTKMSDERGTDG